MVQSADSPDLVPGRECGACTACCQVPLIDEPTLRKEPGVLCVHARGGGCGIYLDRPQTCRAFHCAWRQVDSLPEAARPDRIGVMFWIGGMAQPRTLFDNVGLIGAAIDEPAALLSPQVLAIIDHFRGAALPIFLRWGYHQQMVHPAPDLADAILNPATTPHRELVEPGRTWLARYAPFARQHAGDRVLLPPGW